MTSTFFAHLALFRKEWNTDAQPRSELLKCTPNKHNKYNETKKKIKCFELMKSSTGDVIMTYKGKNFTTEEFCILIDPEADDPTDHYAQICAPDVISFQKYSNKFKTFSTSRFKSESYITTNVFIEV